MISSPIGSLIGWGCSLVDAFISDELGLDEMAD